MSFFHRGDGVDQNSAIDGLGVLVEVLDPFLPGIEHRLQTRVVEIARDLGPPVLSKFVPEDLVGRIITSSTFRSHVTLSRRRDRNRGTADRHQRHTRGLGYGGGSHSDRPILSRERDRRARRVRKRSIRTERQGTGGPGNRVGGNRVPDVYQAKTVTWTDCGSARRKYKVERLELGARKCTERKR
jgi:hypothetical protein